MRPYALIQSVNPEWAPYLALTYARHAEYAARCGADYLTFTGVKEQGLHPSWNRIPLLKEAMKAGYEKVVWLDADALVVNPGVSIFTETPAAPIQMARSDVWMRLGQPHANAGVLVMTNSQVAMDALTWVWSHRHDPPLPHHIAGHWEQSWLADWVDAHPEAFAEMSRRFNYVQTWGAVANPVIQAWHGLPNRLERLRAAVASLNGHVPDPDAMPDEDWLPGDPWRAFLASKPKGLAYFAELTRFIRQHGITSVVEIGVRSGYGLAAMLRGNPTLRYLGIDDGTERPDGLAHAERLRQKYATGEVRFIRTKSQDVQALTETFDLAYIDGEHTESGCGHDLALCAPSCRYVLCDDYDYSPGVRRAVQHFCRASRVPLTYLPTVHGWALMDMRQRGTAPNHQRFQESPTMTYLCVAPMPQYHRVLLTLEPGQTYAFRDDQQAAVDACVRHGILQRIEDIPLPDEEDEDAAAEPTDDEEAEEGSGAVEDEDHEEAS